MTPLEPKRQEERFDVIVMVRPWDLMLVSAYYIGVHLFAAVTLRRRLNSYLVCSLGSMRPLGYDVPETLTQGYYPRGDSVAINAAPRRRE